MSEEIGLKILEEIKGLKEGQTRLETDVAGLKEGQTRLETEVTGLKEDVIGLKNGQTAIKTEVIALAIKWFLYLLDCSSFLAKAETKLSIFSIIGNCECVVAFRKSAKSSTLNKNIGILSNVPSLSFTFVVKYLKLKLGFILFISLKAVWYSP